MVASKILGKPGLSLSLAICSAVVFRHSAVFVLNRLRLIFHTFLPVRFNAGGMASLATPLGCTTGTLRIIFLKVTAAAMPSLLILRSPSGHLITFLAGFRRPLCIIGKTARVVLSGAALLTSLVLIVSHDLAPRVFTQRACVFFGCRESVGCSPYFRAS